MSTLGGGLAIGDKLGTQNILNNPNMTEKIRYFTESSLYLLKRFLSSRTVFHWVIHPVLKVFSKFGIDPLDENINLTSSKTERFNPSKLRILYARLSNLEKYNEIYHRISSTYYENLPEHVPFIKKRPQQGLFLFPIKIKNPKKAQAWLLKQGIDCRTGYSHTLQQDKTTSDMPDKSTIFLPVFQGISKEEQKYVCEKVNEYLNLLKIS